MPLTRRGTMQPGFAPRRWQQRPLEFSTSPAVFVSWYCMPSFQKSPAAFLSWFCFHAFIALNSPRGEPSTLTKS